MSNDWVQDIADMHQKFGVNKWMMDQLGDEEKTDLLHQYMHFRAKMLEEEMIELKLALVENDSEGFVDAIIDWIVFGIGTLDVLGVDARKAWDRVHAANMNKEPGVKPSRPNPFGMPDLIKPEGWEGPRHLDNHGVIDKILEV